MSKISFFFLDLEFKYGLKYIISIYINSISHLKYIKWDINIVLWSLKNDRFTYCQSVKAKTWILLESLLRLRVYDVTEGGTTCVYDIREQKMCISSKHWIGFRNRIVSDSLYYKITEKENIRKLSAYRHAVSLYEGKLRMID